VILVRSQCQHGAQQGAAVFAFRGNARMIKLLRLPLALLCCALSACVTQTIREGTDLSTSGIAYTQAVNALLDATTTEVIDFDNKELIKGRMSSDPGGALAQRDQAMAALLAEIAQFRAQTLLLKAYFVNLQALADSSVKDDAGPAVQSLSDTISKLNVSLGRKQLLTPEQSQQVGALAGLAAQAVQAEKIRRALRRDAPVIGTYLALQQQQLVNITAILKDRYGAEQALFHAEKVAAPYANLKQPLDPAWADARKQWLMSAFSNQQLDAANAAAEQLRGVWADIVQGKNDIGALSDLIGDIDQFVTTADALKSASAKPKP